MKEKKNVDGLSVWMRWDQTGSQNIQNFEANIYINMKFNKKKKTKPRFDFE